MLTSVKIWNATLALVCELNRNDPVRFPITDFTWTQPTKGDGIPKMERPGQHDRYSQVEVMAINMEGDIVASTTPEYWVNRKELLAVTVPDFEDSQIYRFHSHIQIKIDGDPETYYANVVLKDWEAPMEALHPSVTPFQFQWENPFGYWRKVSTNTVAII